MRRRLEILGVLGLALPLLMACAEREPRDPDSHGHGAQAASDANAPGARQTGPHEWEAVIYTYNWGFEPEEIRVPVGAQVTFRITSRDDFHGFTLEGTPVRISAVAPGFATGTYTFQEEGTHRFLCDTYCGAGHYTMEGRVVVAEEQF